MQASKPGMLLLAGLDAAAKKGLPKLHVAPQGQQPPVLLGSIFASSSAARTAADGQSAPAAVASTAAATAVDGGP